MTQGSHRRLRRRCSSARACPAQNYLSDQGYDEKQVQNSHESRLLDRVRANERIEVVTGLGTTGKLAFIQRVLV